MKTSTLITIALLGLLNTCAYLNFYYNTPRYYGSMSELALSIILSFLGFCIFFGFIAGLGFSIAVLIVQYVKKHVNWK